MNANEEPRKKNSDAGRIKHWKEKNFSQYLLYTVVFYKTLIEKYFCSVQQSPKSKRINKQSNKLIKGPWFLLSFTE